MHVDRDTRVRDIALASPRAIELLESWGIDYACHGEEPLGRACAAASIGVDSVVPRLASAIDATPAETGPDWRVASIIELVDHIVSDLHVATKIALSDAGDLVMHCAREQGSAASLRSLFQDLAGAAGALMAHEEEVVFARIRALATARYGKGAFPDPSFGKLMPHLVALRETQAHVHELMRRVRAAADAVLGPQPEHRALSDALRTVEQCLHRQMHLENNILLPRALLLEPVPIYAD